MIVSYKVEIYNIHKEVKCALADTLSLYKRAINYVCTIIYFNWDDICVIEKQLDKLTYIENLIHTTKDNKAKYKAFDCLFYKMPAYIRRDVQRVAFGHISSFMNNLKNYQDKRYKAISNGKKFKEKSPTLNLEPNIMPTFYKNAMYKPSENNSINLKLYNGKTWDYYTLSLKSTDCKYLKRFDENTFKNPQLQFKNNKFYIKYIIEEPDKLLKTKLLPYRKVMSVDLGINTHATCVIMDSNGTIIARKFITDTTDKDRLNFLLQKKRELQRQSGRWGFAPLTHIQHKINCYNTAIENYVSHEIIELALKYDVAVIVFEYLSKFRGKSSEKIHYWRKKAIIKKVSYKSHFYGMRYSTVTPRNTSRLAFDGSGYAERGDNIKLSFSRKKNIVARSFSVCKFKNKKFYNCDLNAAYNIGARYLYREYRKDNPDLDKSQSHVVLNDIWQLAG